MALSYLRLQGFIKQMTKYSEISNYLSAQTFFTSSGAQAVSSHSNIDLDRSLEPDSEINVASDADPKTDYQKAAHTKKLHHRILTVSEVEEEKKWKEAARFGRYGQSDSFGDMWKGKQRNVVRDSNSPKLAKKFSQKNQKNFAKKMFEENRKAKNDANTFGKLSDDRSLRPLLEDVGGQRPVRNTKKMFEDSRKAKNDVNTFGKLSDDRSLRPLLEDVGGQRPVRSTKKMFEESRKAKNDANTFGKLSDDRSLRTMVEDVGEERFLDDESDAKEGRSHIRLSKVGRFQEPHWYAKKISHLGKEGKVLEAIDMLEETMLKRDRVMPTTYVFNQLFGILGNVGYTKKAFQLFNKMKKMGLQPDGHTYTSLFNCCSNSPWPNDGLQRTNNLHELIRDKDISLHPITFKAMVKAYGVCGDIQAAFQAADEMCKLHRPDQQLYSFLLMACVSDTKTGLRHAIQVWKLMRKMNIKPDLPLYNLLLRVIRDSGLGIDEDIKKFPQSRNLHSEEIKKGQQDPLPYSDEGETDKEFFMKTKSIDSQNAVAVEVRESDVSDVVDSASSLFGGHPVCTSVDLKYPENRLAVLGGPTAILQDMKKNGVSPNVLTFTQIIDSLPQENEAELQVLEYMKAENIARDIDMYNMIIRRRNRRNDYRAANDVLKYIVEENIFLNQRTFGCLAMGCTTLPKAKKLLQSINEAGLEPNIEIFGVLAYKSSFDFKYKEALLDMLKKRNIYPNTIFLQHVERSIESARKKILKIERNETVGDYFKSGTFKTSFENFMISYSKWLKAIGFDKPEHPWEDFRHSKDDKEEDSQKDVQC